MPRGRSEFWLSAEKMDFGPRFMGLARGGSWAAALAGAMDSILLSDSVRILEMPAATANGSGHAYSC